MKKECNLVEEKIEITTFGCDKIKGSSRMEFCNSLIPSYVHKNGIRYLNVSVYNCECARVAEWLMHSFDTRCPSGLMGSNPIPGVFSFSYDLNTVDVHVGNWGFPSGQFCIHQGGARTLSGPQNTECEGKGRFAMLRSKRGREIKMMKCKYLYSILDSILLRSILNEI